MFKLPPIPGLAALSAAQMIAGALAVIAVVGLIAWFLLAPGCERRRAANAHADAVISQGRTKAATDAVGVVVGNAAAESETDATTRSNRDAITSAPGAGATVDPGVSDAGRRALCMRRAYAGSPACQRLLHPGS